MIVSSNVWSKLCPNKCQKSCMGFFSFAHTNGTYAIQNRASAVDQKAVLAQHVLSKLGTCKAIEVTDTTANRALLVKVVFAIAFGTNVLIKRSASLATVELAQNLGVAKLGEVTVKTAFAGGSLLVDLAVKLLNGKLAVGIATEKGQ